MASLQPSDWREALGGELTAAQVVAEYSKVQAAVHVDLVDWLRSRSLDRKRQELQAWHRLDSLDWVRLAEQLADEAAQERQRPARLSA
jgi:hypothetical protein